MARMAQSWPKGKPNLKDMKGKFHDAEHVKAKRVEVNHGEGTDGQVSKGQVEHAADGQLANHTNGESQIRRATGKPVTKQHYILLRDLVCLP